MKVEALTYTPDFDRVIASAARICYSEYSASQEFSTLTADKICKLIRRLKSNDHMSPFEHASITFSVEGISRACSHQLVRHRVASYTQQSQRYVKFDSHSYNFVIPNSIYTDEANLKVFDEVITAIQSGYQQLIDNGVKPEDARYLLPNASETQIVVTMNARELLHFFDLRCDKHAQWEIRDLANRMKTIAQTISPDVFSDPV